MRMSSLSTLHLSRTCVFLASIVLVAGNASRWTPSGLQDTRTVPVVTQPLPAHGRVTPGYVRRKSAFEAARNRRLITKPRIPFPGAIAFA
jgi:hypothetical protein